MHRAEHDTRMEGREDMVRTLVVASANSSLFATRCRHLSLNPLCADEMVLKERKRVI